MPVAATVPADRSQLDRLISPQTVAVIGASGDVQKTAGRPARYLKEHGYAGHVYLVNPRYESIDGLTCYPSVAALPTVPDVGLIVLGTDRATDAVRELAKRGAAAAIVLAGGYAEVGPNGQRLQEELRSAAGSMRLLGPNSMGLVNVAAGATLSPSGSLEVRPLLPGKVALVSQSGGILGSLLSRAVARGIGFSKLVATGNEADLNVLDFIEYFLDDPETNVIALYLEGLRDAQRLRGLAARALEAGKPIVVFKVGRSEAGARSATSHTGALAGSDRIYDAFFAQLGVVRVRSFTDLLDVPAALSAGKTLKGKRLGVLTSTGGAGVLVTDACGVLGLESPLPDAAVVEQLTELLSDEGAVADRNPVDITLAGLKPEVFTGATSALLNSPTYDGVVVVVGASGLAKPDLAARPVIECAAQTDKPLVVYVSPYAPNILSHLNRKGVPAFDTPEGCAAALAAMEWFGRLKTNLARVIVAGVPALGQPGLSSLRSGPLNEIEAKQLFGAYGIPAVREIVAASPEEAASAAKQLGTRVVLKVLSRDIAHKSDAGGVLVGVPAADVGERAAELLSAVRTSRPEAVIDGLLVQEQAQGIEMILGFIRDPQLGPTILLGAGGVTAEVLGDTVLRLPPFGLEDAHNMVRSLKSYPLLTGYRGRPAPDVDALAHAVVDFSDMVLSLGDRLLEAEINPLFVMSPGKGVLAADGLAVLA